MENNILGMHIPLDCFEIVLGDVHIHIERFRTEGFDGIEVLFSSQVETTIMSNHRILVQKTKEKANAKKETKGRGKVAPSQRRLR